MSRGPGIREIFSSQALGKTDTFQFENQESKQQMKLSKNKDADAPSQMKKFGGYKPKILGGEIDFLEVQDDNPGPDTTARSQADQAAPSLRPQSTNPKPWVIGDKNVPMVLGSINDNNDEDSNNNNNTEQQISDSNVYNSSIHSEGYNSGDRSSSHRTFSISSDTSTLVSQNSDSSRQGIDNPLLYGNGFNSVDDSVSISVAPETDTDLGDYKTNGVHEDRQVSSEPVGVFIPAPDYGEDEKTLDFNSEDTDDHSDGGDPPPRQTKPKAAVKIYDGADLSHYLSEDEVEQQEVVLRNEPKARNTQGRKTKSDIHRPKVNEKQSVFKQSPNKSKRKSSGNAPTFNNVRSFSYADSKFGTKGKAMGKSLSSSNLTDDSEMFLSANTQQSSYESFLRSRHADDLPSESSYNGGEHGEVDQSTKLRHKDDPVWKKLTLRLKNKVSKSTGTKEQ